MTNSDALEPIETPKIKIRSVDRRQWSKEYRGPKLDDLLPVKSGDKQWEFKLETRCKVCQKGTQFLSMVNALLATGASYADVLRSIAMVNQNYPLKNQVTYSSLRSHQKRHLPYDSFAIREIIERRAAEQNKDFIAGTGTLLDPAGYAEAMMVKGMQNLSTPGAFVSPSDGLAAAKTLYSITKNEEGDSTALEAAGQLNKVISAVRAIVPEEYWTAIVSYLNNEELESAKVEDVPVVDVVTEEEIDDFDPGAIFGDDVDERDGDW